jgi:hypothetical protein
VKTYLPYSEPKDRIIDALTVLGALIAGIAYPQGVHTGLGAPLFGLWAMVANLAVYTVFWYVCLQLIRYSRRKDGNQGPATS